MQLGVWLAQCEAGLRQMESGGLSHSDLSRRIRQFCSAYLSNRKLVAGTLAVLALFILFWPSGRSAGDEESEASAWCLGEQLRQWAREEAAFDAHIRHAPQARDWEKNLVGFLGNGRFGLAIGDGKEEVRMRGGRALSLLTDLKPTIAVTASQLGPSSDAIVTDYRKGVVIRLQSYKVVRGRLVTRRSWLCNSLFDRKMSA